MVRDGYFYGVGCLIAAGVIGPVRRVENWSSRPFWPQGLNRPDKADPTPEGLDWNLWLGPAPDRPFSHIYLPFVWRGWYDFGAGAIGDMGNYSFDTIFRALKLGPPVKVELRLSRWPRVSWVASANWRSLQRSCNSTKVDLRRMSLALAS